MTETAGLWALFASSFLAATLLPGGSEVVLFGYLTAHPGQFWLALLVATMGNTLGGLSSYLIGRLIPQRVTDARSRKALDRVARHGSSVLLLSWVPLLGDPLCVAAGWLRLNPWLAAFWMAVGKCARYVAIAYMAI